MKWFFYGLRNYAVFSGRASRKEFWMFFLFYIIFLFSFAILDAILGTIIIYTKTESYGLFTLLYFIGTFIPFLAVSVRRLHDIGKSGWWILLSFVPIGNIIYIILLATKGSSFHNKYGPPPEYTF